MKRLFIICSAVVAALATGYLLTSSPAEKPSSEAQSYSDSKAPAPSESQPSKVVGHDETSSKSPLPPTQPKQVKPQAQIEKTSLKQQELLNSIADFQSSIVTSEDRKNLSAEEQHFTPKILIQAARKLGKMHQLAEEAQSGSAVTKAADAIRRCAIDSDVEFILKTTCAQTFLRASYVSPAEQDALKEELDPTVKKLIRLRTKGFGTGQ